MEVRRSIEREVHGETFGAGQIRALLADLDIVVKGETYSDFTCLCPFHYNKDTPAFAISKTTGQWYCFNRSCNRSGDLLELVKQIKDKDDFQALRYIYKIVSRTESDVKDSLISIMHSKEQPRFKEFPQQLVDQLHENYLQSDIAIEYMHSRGFTDVTAEQFNIGFSTAKQMVTVPLHSPDGLLVGIVGRAIDQKVFKNSTGLPTSQTLFNLHNAKTKGSTVIITEAAFDTMRIVQAGYPNCIANLGGHMSAAKIKLLERYFDKIIIMTDFDTKKTFELCKKCSPEPCKGHNAGRDLGMMIAKELSHKNVYWAAYDYKIVYPSGAKDAGDLTEDEIRKCIENAVPHYEYALWDVY